MPSASFRTRKSSANSAANRFARPSPRVVDAPKTLVAWVVAARDDLREIHRFVARDSPHYAELLVDQWLAAVDRLERFPLSGRIVPELQREDVREVIYGKEVARVLERRRRSGYALLPGRDASNSTGTGDPSSRRSSGWR